MNHLTPDELIDAVEDALAPARRAHIAGCDVCRSEVAQLSEILNDTRAIVMPEPSPLFWERLSYRVRTAITEEPVVTTRLPRWLQWPVLVPVAGLALVLVALASAIPTTTVDTARTGASVTSAPISEVVSASGDLAEDTWAVVTDLIGPLDIETVEAAGFVGAPGAADQAVFDLTREEQEELVKLLKQELAGS